MDIEIAKKLQPLQVTYAELVTILGPLTLGYAWGEDTIRDLWLLGAPLPQEPARRIVFPNKLMEWLDDVLTRQGRPLDEAAKTYLELRKKSA